jgi:hypothetical protein
MHAQPRRRFNLIVQARTCCGKRYMGRERRGHTLLEHLDQGRQSGQATVIRKFTGQSLPGLAGVARMTPVQRVQHIVAKHDVAAVDEDVELHGGERQKS